MKIFKNANCVILTLAIVLATCISAFVVISGLTTTYYVSAVGSDTNEGSEASPLLTIGAAIDKANTQNISGDNTVTIKVLGETAVDWGGTDKQLPSHDYELIITSAATEGGATVGNGTASINFGGNVTFDNIKVNFGKTYQYICAAGNDVTFTESCTLGGNNQMSYFSVGAFNSDYKGTYNDDITFVNNMKLMQITLLNSYSECTLNGKLNIIYNNSAVTPKFYLNTYDNKIHINNAINIELRASKGANFVAYSKGSNSDFGENGCIQVLNAGTVDVSIADTKLSTLPSEKIWVLNNSLHTTDLISFSGTMGKFKVDTTLYENIKAISATNSEVVINEKDGYLELPAGQYTITAQKIPLKATYFVSANGSDENDGKTENTPVTTVQKAIELANTLGFTHLDYVTVKLLGESVNMGDMPAYDYNLIVEGTKTEDKVTQLVMNSNKTIANSLAKGLTTYKTVELYIAAQFSRYEATSSNIVFESDAKLSGSYAMLVYGTQTDGGGARSIAGQKIVLKTATPEDGVNFGNFGWCKRTYTEDVELILDYESKHIIRFNTYASGEPKVYTIYDKNVNIHINQAKGLEFLCLGGTTFNGGLNIFNNSNILINENTPGYENLPENTWILTNKSQLDTPLVTTDIAGQFTTSLDSNFVKVIATDSNNNKFETQDGTIILNAGEYEIDVKCIGEHKYGDYVRDNNASCGKNETETATCEYCGSKTSREIENTALDHEYSSVVDKICNNCEAVRTVSGKHLIKDAISGEYVLYEDGTISQKTELIEVNGKTLYIVAGKWAQKTTIIKNDEKWLYIKDGEFDNTYSGLIEYQSKQIYIKNGEWDNTYSAIIDVDGRGYYVRNGIRSNETGIVEDSEKSYYVRNGRWDGELTSLVNYLGVRHYINNGEWTDMTGIVEYRGHSVFIKDGIWNSATITLYEKGGKLYAVKNGKWYKGENLIHYSDNWYYVKDGFAMTDFSGEVELGLITYSVNAGIVENANLSAPVERPLNKKEETPVEPEIWLPTLEEIPTETPRIITWGDSITRGMGMSKADKYPTVMGELIGDGYTVINGGSSGEKSHTIAARQGAYAVYLDKDVVFESGEATVQIGTKGDHSFILADDTKLALNSYGEAFNNEIPADKVYINGEEYGLSVSANNFYLTRENSDSAIALSKGTEVILSSAQNQKGSYCEIFYVGANDGISSNKSGIDYIINRYKAMIARHGNYNYIIIIPQWDRGFVEPFKKEFGDKAFDLRGMLCSSDLSIVGLEPTETDIAEQQACIIPTSLKYENNPNDALHLNAYGYKMMGTLLYEHGVKLGYWQ